MGISDFIQTLGNTFLDWVLVGGGLILIGVAIKDLVVNLSGNDKKWGKALGGLAVGVIGGLLCVFGVSGVIAFFKAKGNDVPHA